MNLCLVYTPIDALDLSTVRIRLMHPRAGLGWSAARSIAAEQAYRAFLLEALQSPLGRPAPTADVDAFWHFHILDTHKYAADCLSVFGYFLHHQPALEFAGEAAGSASQSRGATACCARSAAYCAAAAPAVYCAISAADRVR